ncbi:MAG TPA: hypothetical protein VFP84_26245 [Kofleriaceae bacterium]|nr:hypothetical protein [Kofleriaceae bacterium]
MPESPAPSTPRRLIARFALLAFGLYHVPLVLNAYPSFGGGGAAEHGLAVSWGHIFGHVGLWVARHVLGFTGPMTYALSGDNGDTGSEIGRVVLGLAIAVVAAAIWTAADRARPGARWVEPALHVLLRYAIALGLASYAVGKILPVQFAPLDDVEYEARLGELTPMRLMWSFMQYSRGYSLFAGVLEMTVIVLVAFRRTATLGALLCIVVMTNVVLMDLCFDVPVKLFSTSMVLSAAALVVFDARRLVAVVLHRPVPPPVPPDPMFASPAMRALGWLAKLVLIGGVIVSSFVTMWDEDFETEPQLPVALRGAWRPVPGGPSAGWRRLAVGEYASALRREDDTLWFCQTRPTDASHIALTCSERRGGEPHTGTLAWARHGEQLELAGTFDGAPLAIELRAVSDTALPLRRHVTRWVSDD